jgi:hypothetical protein
MAVIPLYLDADLQSVRKIVNDCVRDGVHFDSGFVAQIQLQEYPQFETPLRIIWGISHSAIEAAHIADHRTQLKLLPVKGIHHDGEVWRVWKIISQQLYNAKLIESLAHRWDEGAEAIGEVFGERDLIASPRPQTPDEEKFKKARRAELKRNPNARLCFGRKPTRADIKNALSEMWETEKQSCAKRQAQWDEIHRLSALSLEQAIAEYLQRGGETPTQDTATTMSNEPQPEQGKSEQKELQPWEKIPDHAWDKQALKLWWEGFTCPEIGLQVNVTGDRVRNRLSELRKEHGEEIVPTDEKRKRQDTIG